MTATAISDAEFAALMAPFLAPGPVVAGVSGGADSMALAWLLRRWGHPLAVIVDHGLRPGSDREAARTARRLATIGVPARIVTLDLPRGPDLGARAREARYHALLSVCRESGRPDLLVAHHAADQAETVALRAARGSGPDGLAGMAPVAWRGQARILRPLLGQPPARLRATLQAAGLGWEDDPTNRDPATARGALRATGLPPGPLLAQAHAAALARHAHEAAVAEELAASVTFHPAGFARLSAPLSAPAWSALVWTLSGAPHPPPPAGAARLARMGQGTLAGVRVMPGWAGREAAAMAAPVPARAGACWDGRFVLLTDHPGAEIGALGQDAPSLRRRPGPPLALLRTVPALRQGGTLVCVPHLACSPGGICRNVGLDYRSARCLAGAPFALAGSDGFGSAAPGASACGGAGRPEQGSRLWNAAWGMHTGACHPM